MSLYEELAVAIDRGDSPAVMRLLGAASEEERQLAGEHIADHALPRPQPGLRDQQQWSARLNSWSLARLGVAPLPALKRLPPQPFRGDASFVTTIALRPARFRDGLVKWLLGTDARAMQWWPDVRGAERAGLVERPDSPHYWAGMVQAFSKNWQDSRRPNPERINAQAESIGKGYRADPVLLDEIWDVLADERAVRRMHSDPMRTAGWAEAIRRYVHAGQLDRDQVIDAVLRGFLMGWKHSITRVFSLMVDGLAPTADEIVRRSGVVVRMVDCDSPTGQKCALGLAAKLVDDSTIDADALANALRAPLAGSQKANAVAALKLLGRLVPTTGGPALAAAATGLGHSNTDVQAKAVALLARHRQLIAANPEVRAEVLAWGDVSSPTLAGELQELTGIDSEAAPADAPTLAEPLFERTAAVAGRWWELLDLDDAAAAVRSGAMPEAATFALPDAPWLCDERRFQTVATLDELLGLLPSALASSDPYLLEQALDGLSRMGDRRPEPGIGKALQKQAVRRNWNKDEVSVSLIADQALGGVVHAWTAQTVPEALEYLDGDAVVGDVTGALVPPVVDEQQQYLAVDPDGGTSGSSLQQLHVARCWEVGRRVANGLAGPLLATPTHGWWVEAGIFADRLDEYLAAGVRPGRFDAVVALLRLWPHAEHDLVSRLAASPSEVGRAAARVLGADVAVADAGLERASRANRVVIGDVGFEPSRYGAIAVRFDVEHEPEGFRRDDPTGAIVPLLVDFDRFRRVRWTLADGHLLGFEGSMRWGCATSLRLAPIIAAAIGAGVASDIDADRSAPRIDDAVLTFFDSDVPLDDTSFVMLAACLGSKSQRIAGAAVEVLGAAADDGRFDPDRLGATIARLFDGGVVQLGRCGPNLYEVGRGGTLAAELVRRTLVAAVAKMAEFPQRPVPLLEPLVELGSGLGRGVEDAVVRDRLSTTAKGSSKRARLARAALELPTEWSMGEPEVLALSALVDRAERWEATAPHLR